METAGYPLKLKNADNLNTMFIVTSSSPSLRVHIIVRFLNTKSDENIHLRKQFSH
jgi:putative ribosome biogenesis GTPase RsgA